MFQQELILLLVDKLISGIHWNILLKLLGEIKEKQIKIISVCGYIIDLNLLYSSCPCAQKFEGLLIFHQSNISKFS